MPRIRTLKPEIWQSVQVMNLSHSARLLFIGLITQADDEGRGVADQRRLRVSIFGADDVQPSDIKGWLDELVKQRLVQVYETERFGTLYCLPSWKDHQRINRPTPSRYPSPIDLSRDSLSTQ